MRRACHEHGPEDYSNIACIGIRSESSAAAPNGIIVNQIVMRISVELDTGPGTIPDHIVVYDEIAVIAIEIYSYGVSADIVVKPVISNNAALAICSES